MNQYKADLHIHTLLSPCGDLEMSPRNIISAAKQRGLHIIGITDHNSTFQAPLVKELGQEAGLFVLCGAEVTTREEIHCLAFSRMITLFSSFRNTSKTIYPIYPMFLKNLDIRS